MLPNREGLFNAHPVQIGIDETGPNNLATCIINFKLYEELQPSGEWADCSADNFDISGYFYLEKKDGSLNTVTIDALKDALGWDGRDPFWLQEADLSEHAVQVKLALEEYGGKTRMKVQYLNPFGSTGGGGVTKADDATRKSITNRINSKLRALAGPAPAAAKPAGKPAPKPAASAAAPLKLPPAKPKAQPPASPPPPAARTPEPPTAEAPADPQAATMEEAWGEFCKHCPPPKWDQEAIEKEWFRILAAMFPGRQPDELTPAEWAAMRDEGPAQIIPF
jgi:hypothetical protein